MTTFDPRTVHTTHPHHVGQPFTGPQQYGQQQYGQAFPGQQFSGPMPAPALAKPSRKRPLAGKIVAGVVAAAVVAGGAGAWMAFSGPSAAAAVQSTSFAGANPTTSPFGTDAPQVAAVAATGPQSGDTTGLYAATTPPACTTADFLTQLQADPAKLAAFGGVFGLGAGDVPAFVDSLAPVVLRANTSVTDHPYADGAFTPEPAVLAAGTAVLVNSYGEPTVKCFNGNPLTAGEAAADAVTVVPTTQIITQYSFTTIDNSRVVIIPGKPDPKPHPGPNPTTTPQPDPELVKKAQEAQATADTARAEATAARERADGFAAAARQAQTNLNSLQADLDRAIAEGANPQVIADLTKARDAAAGELETKNNQAKFADAAAKSAEGTAEQAEKNAKEAKQKADDSAKAHAEDAKTKDEEKPKDATKTVVDPATTGKDGQAAAGQQGQNKVAPKPVVTAPQVCAKVVTDATATPTCPLTGSADQATGTAPVTSGTTSTGGEKPSTGTSSKGTDTTSGASSSSSSSGSKSDAKEGSDH